MRWVWLVLAVLIAVVATAFTLQNSSFRAPLQLDLWVAAWRLKSPASVPALMWASFGAGAVVGGGAVALRSFFGRGFGRRAPPYNPDVAMGGATRANDPWAGT